MAPFQILKPVSKRPYRNLRNKTAQNPPFAEVAGRTRWPAIQSELYKKMSSLIQIRENAELFVQHFRMSITLGKNGAYDPEMEIQGSAYLGEFGKPVSTWSENQGVGLVAPGDDQTQGDSEGDGHQDQAEHQDNLKGHSVPLILQSDTQWQSKPPSSPNCLRPHRIRVV